MPRGLQVNGSEVAARGDALSGQRGLHVVAIEVRGKPDHEDEPAYGAVRYRTQGELQALTLGQQTEIPFGCSGAQSQHLREAGQLHAAQGAGEFRETVVIAGLGVIEPIGSAASLIA